MDPDAATIGIMRLSSLENQVKSGKLIATAAVGVVVAFSVAPTWAGGSESIDGNVMFRAK